MLISYFLVGRQQTLFTGICVVFYILLSLIIVLLVEGQCQWIKNPAKSRPFSLLCVYVYTMTILITMD